MRIPTWIFQQIENQIMPMLKYCTNFIDLRKIHGRIIVASMSQSRYLATQIINVCNTIGKVDYAALVFNQITDPNALLYNAMIRAYTRNGHYFEAINLYKQMVRSPQAQLTIFADSFTYPFVIKACAGILFLDFGKQVHTHVFKSGLQSISIVQNSLIEMYGKCDDLTNVQQVFDEMTDRDALSCNTLISAYVRLGHMKKASAIFNMIPNKTVVSWTALICGYASSGNYSKAVGAFHQMQLEGLEPDDVSIVSILPACAHIGALELGRWLHAYSNKHGFTKKIYVCNALIEMYSKCGSVDQANQIFDEMRERDVITWSSMIGGLASNGRAHAAIGLFLMMENEKRVRPNKITFVGVLSACAHGGLLKEGTHYFNSMKHIYGFDPDVEHYGCLIDLLVRSGCIVHAMEIIDSMPMNAGAEIWGSLLSACRTHGDVNTAAKAMEKLTDLEPEDSGNYVLLSNAYATAGNWDGVAKLRRMMKSRKLKRKPGCSLIEVNNVVKEFVAGDYLNPQFGEISEILDLLGLTTAESEEQVNSVDSSYMYNVDFLGAEACRTG